MVNVKEISKNISVMIKPSSSKCQMACQYCFYRDLAESRKVKDFGYMNDGTRDNIIEKTLRFAAGGDVTFAFQGGEPTLIGLDFYKEFKAKVDLLNQNNCGINYSIQTNGMKIDKDWIGWLKENKVLVGISLDGTEKIHNIFRQVRKRQGTFNQVYGTIKSLQAEQVDFNILTVVTDRLACDIEEVFKFYIREGFQYLQFIPLIYSKDDKILTGKNFGRFLVNLYDLWVKELKKGNQVSIRFFDNLSALIKGYDNLACEMRGHCSMQNIIEADGSIYPCDFYATEEYKIGNINQLGFYQIYKNERVINFIKSSFERHRSCKSCNFFIYCRGGCRRYLLGTGKNLYCGGYKYFFENRLEDFKSLIRKGKIK